MAYDPDLAVRVRTALHPYGEAVEKPMFGGLGMMLGGHLAVCVSGPQDGLVVRVPPEEQAGLCARPGVVPMQMGPRTARGWVVVATDVVDADDALEEWVARGAGVARSLPPK